MLRYYQSKGGNMKKYIMLIGLCMCMVTAIGCGGKKSARVDAKDVLAKIGDRGYSAHTMECVKTTFKVFYRWMYGLERTDPAPKLVRWLSKENVPTKIRKEDLLTKKDIEDMTTTS